MTEPDARGRGTLLFAGAVTSLLALLAIAAATLDLGPPEAGGPKPILRAYIAAFAVFAGGVVLVRRLKVRRALALIVVGGAALQAVAVGFEPSSTDDFYRYIWDGKVQAAGIDPYRYTPLDPALAGLRDEFLFPPDPRSPEQVAAALATGRTDLCTSLGVPHDCTRINRPGVNTIYPPVAEAAFLGLHYLSPNSERKLAVQAFGALLAMATTWVLIWALRRSGRDPRAAVLWAWCPLVWLEAGNNAHIDVLGILLLTALFGVLASRAPGVAVSTRRLIAAGALFGAAIAVKLVPVLVGPALLIRRGHILLGTALAVIVASYLPHVLVVGSDVLGYLPGYLDEEGYAGTQRFGVPRLLVPDAIAGAVAVGVLVVISGYVWRRAGERPNPGDALLVTGAAFVLVGPSQPWYGMLLVALVVLSDRPEWLAVAAAAYPVYLASPLGVDNTLMQQRTYLPAALLVLAVTLTRRRARRPEPALRASGRPAG